VFPARFAVIQDGDKKQNRDQIRVLRDVPALICRGLRHLRRRRKKFLQHVQNSANVDGLNG
jgi:hypothetical protein